MFKQRHIVITGGSSGLGLALAGRLLDKGARVTLVARQRRVWKAPSVHSSPHGPPPWSRLRLWT